jgi:phage shock protein C
MSCLKCQREIAEYSNYCYFCGARQSAHAPVAGAPRGEKRLMRSSTDVKVAGVCAGFAEYFGWDATVVRLIWVVLTIMPVPISGLIGYLVAWVVMPVAPAPISAVTAPNPYASSVPNP